eukprot:Nitzschia sp. Nitz4//scaffold25_size161228//48616//54500//NITZ4_002422-RA/size161228-snap-gene-0.22-mRNA-1//-1//CDS//3329544562//7080//frame0
MMFSQRVASLMALMAFSSLGSSLGKKNVQAPNQPMRRLQAYTIETGVSVGGVTDDSMLTCPDVADEPIAFNYASTRNGRQGFANAAEGTLCTLVEVSADGQFITPIARSYDGKSWEATGGKFADTLNFKCTGTSCIIRLQAPSDGVTYHLSSFDGPDYSDRDLVARFLEQASFGPSRSDIDDFLASFGNPTANGFANWVKNQQDEDLHPILSHRAIYRQHLNAGAPINNPVGPVTQPCQEGTRYRRAAFTQKDYKETVNFQQNSDGNYILSVRGYFRTVAPGPIYIADNEIVTWDGDYTICHAYEDEQRFHLKFTREDMNGACVEVLFNQEANPLIELDFSQTDIQLVDIPSNSAEFIDSIYFENFDLQEQEIILTRDVSSVTCGLADTNSYQSVFAYYDNTYWIHDPRFRIFENTLATPISDGGGTVEEIYANSDDSSFTVLCSNTPRTFLNEDKCHLSIEPSACSYTIGADERVDASAADPGTVVCGSPYEVANEPFLGGSVRRGAFEAEYAQVQAASELMPEQRNKIWSHIILNDHGQLRQRVAWALAQILAISPGSLSGVDVATEPWVAYYDIFVRHAFGNYRDILKEVSFSPMMADMLTYWGGRSTAYVWEKDRNLEYADENYAREIMQLFTTGLLQLNMDGTKALDSEGNPVRVYNNNDVEEYARVWTGFLSQKVRGNLETPYENNIDPMYVDVDFRDRFPKMGLDGVYIGDGYPLCSSLSTKHFLSSGAKFRLLGSAPKPELLEAPSIWYEYSGQGHSGYLELQSSSDLYSKLCASSGAGSCEFPLSVVLDSSLSCQGNECDVNTVRVVKVNGMYYEYIRPPCVHQAFFDSAQSVSRRKAGDKVMCADPSLDVATPSCCSGDYSWWDEKYFGERTSFTIAESRCGGKICALGNRPDCDEACEGNNNYFWGNEDCTLGVTINNEGKVAVVHFPDGYSYDDVDPSVSATESKTFFRVNWSGDYSSVVSNCESNSNCFSLSDGLCRCEVSVEDSLVFSSTPSRSEVLSSLSIGSLEPESGSVYVSGDVSVYNVGSGGQLTADTVFGVVDDNGIQHWLQNKRSDVLIGGTSVSFRNPPHFIHLADAEPRDAYYETDAALDHYIYHPNTAPFLAVRFAQRFGVSNPSPRYIEAIASAFKSGSYTSGGESFGSGTYGDLGAAIAATLLDDEARSVELDADPTHGSLREPLIKLMGMMRSLDFQLASDEEWVEFSTSMRQILGQMSHEIPHVFSFFLPEYRPAGPVAQASLYSPESQVLTGPRIIDTANGMLGLIRYGLNPCIGGLGKSNRRRNYVDCSYYDGTSFGELAFEPQEGDTVEIIDELATLLTAGRLSAKNRDVIRNAIVSAPSGSDPTEIAQLLISTTPEFHSTNLVRKNGQDREPEPANAPSSRPYKAVVYVHLQGGADSFNMLVPHSCSATNTQGQTLLQQYNNERTSIALTVTERNLVIDAQDQPCSQFAVHPNIPIVQELYNNGDLAFFANIGVLDKPVDNTNYADETRSELFAHDKMQDEAQRIDPWDEAEGTGILGRMSDILLSSGFNPRPITVSDATVATVGLPGESVEPVILSESGLNEFDAEPENKDFDVNDYVGQLNDGTKLQSGVFAETWSAKLLKAISDAGTLAGVFNEVDLSQQYEAGDGYQSKMQVVANTILTQSAMGVDRDIIFVQMGGWDHHDNLKENLSNELEQLNGALEIFANEMKAQGLWDQVTVVVNSEFGRTLTPNSGEGSDHAWGGNAMMMGGSVNGGQIFGEYPADITTDSALNIGRGRLIPTSSWESMFNGVAEWMGVESEADLEYCMPNRDGTGTKLYTQNELFQMSRRLRRSHSN